MWWRGDICPRRVRFCEVTSCSHLCNNRHPARSRGTDSQVSWAKVRCRSDARGPRGSRRHQRWEDGKYLIVRRRRAVGIEWIRDGLEHRLDYWIGPAKMEVCLVLNMKPRRGHAYALAVNLSNTSMLDRTTRHIFKTYQ